MLSVRAECDVDLFSQGNVTPTKRMRVVCSACALIKSRAMKHNYRHVSRKNAAARTLNDGQCVLNTVHEAKCPIVSLILMTACLSAPLPAAHAAAAESRDLSVNALKKMSLEELMNIQVVSVSRSPEKLSDATSSVQVITREDIRRAGATSLPEALRLASNLQVAQKNSHDWAISARGFNTDLANKLLVMIDGRTVYTPLFSGVFWNAQDYPLEDIDHIEVISGPGGTLWGANAVNGVINIITRRARDTQGLYLDAGGGSGLQDFADARYGGAIGSHVNYRVYAKYLDRDSNVFANGSDADDAWRMAQGGFRADSSWTADRITWQGDVYSNSNDTALDNRGRMRGVNTLGRWSHTLGNGSQTRLQLYYDHTHLDDPLGPYVINNITLAPAGILTDALDTYDIDFQHHVKLMQHHDVVWGLGYRHTHDEVGNTAALAFYPPVLDQSLYSGFIQDEVALSKQVSVTLGTKLEHNDYTGFELEPSVHLKWNINPQHMMWGAVSRAVRSPSRVDRDLSEPAAGLVVLKGSKDFVSETVMAYEAGYRMQAGQRLIASLSTYYNDYQHVRSTSITPATLIPFYFANNLKGYTYGVELSGTWQAASWWRLRFGYSYLHENLRVTPGQFDLSNAQNETADPANQVMLRSMFDLPHQVQLDAALRWIDTLHINNGPVLGVVPSYFEADVRAGWHITSRLDIALIAHNLLHAHHPEYGFPDANRIEATRSIIGKVTWRL